MPNEPLRRQFRVQATMPDGSTADLYASTTSPDDALKLSLETWRGEGLQPARVAVYAGRSGKGRPLVEWPSR